MSNGLRTAVLNAAGRTFVARRWAQSKCSVCEVSVAKTGNAIALRRGERKILIAPKHIFYAPEICAGFEVFAAVLPALERDGMAVTDFSVNPDALNLERKCLAAGTTLESREGTVWLRKGRHVMVMSAQHAVYAATISGQFDMYFTPLVPMERDGLQMLDFSRPGNVQKYAKSGLEFAMASFPEEEEAIEEYFRWYRPQPGDLVFDMGAHCGVSTYYLAKLVGPEGKVVCFEPDPQNFAILQQNLQRHGLSNVTAVQAAIAGESGKLAFNSEGTIGSGLSSLLLRKSVGNSVMVDAYTLAEVFARWGTPAFCKIDIEGAEIEAVGKAMDAVRASGTNFALDTHHPQANGEMTSERMEELFRACGYESASEANPLWTTWARPAKAA